MFSIIDSILSMKMDIYKQSELQDPDTGALKKEWMFYKTVPCHAKGVISNSSSTRNGDYQTFKDRYTLEQIVVVRTESKLNMREKITNICGPDGTTIWTELDYPSDTPTVFEVIGTTPMTDPFGRVVAYNSTLRRSESQKIGI